MFDVHWNDPTRELVGQHKQKKEPRAISRSSSMKSSHSSNSKNSKKSKSSMSGGSVPPPPKIPLFGGLFVSNKKGDLVRASSSSILSTPAAEAQNAKRLSNYIPPPDVAAQLRSSRTIVGRESSDSDGQSNG